MTKSSPSPERPVVSVVMPVRNAENTIEAAIQSITAQTMMRWELMITDDGSTDATPDILEQAAAADPRIHVHRMPPLGIVSALNHGISCCNAPWIARMDADDTMMPQRLALQLGHAADNPELGVISGLVSHGGSPGGLAMYIDWLNSVTSPEAIELKRYIESPVAHPSVMFRRELIDDFGGYHSGDFPEDYELWLRWLDAGVKFGKVPHPILAWNDCPGRLTRSDPRYHVEKFYKIKLIYLATWLSQNIDPTREIWLWGAGRITRKRFTALPAHGIPITGYIDVDLKKCGHRRDNLTVVLPTDLPDKNRAFVIAGVAKHGARDLIRTELDTRGYIEGLDYIHAA